jgi:hypothetical protein
MPAVHHHRSARARRIAIATLLLLVAALPGCAADQLWGKAVGFAAASADWVPGNATFELSLVDDKGATQESWQFWYKLSTSATGGVSMEVFKARHNSEDTTSKEQEAQKKRKPQAFSMGDNPFDPAVQGAVTAAPRGRGEAVAGRDCAVYDFTLKKKDGGVLTGTAWLDAGNGAPVQVRSTASPLPRGVFEMTTTLRYAPGPGGEGFLKEALVDGVGGVLFIRRSFRTAITVDGYWRRGSR